MEQNHAQQQPVVINYYIGTNYGTILGDYAKVNTSDPSSINSNSNVTQQNIVDAINACRNLRSWDKECMWAVMKVLAERNLVIGRPREFANYLMRIGIECENVVENIRKLDSKYIKSLSYLRTQQWDTVEDCADSAVMKQIETARMMNELIP